MCQFLPSSTDLIRQRLRTYDITQLVVIAKQKNDVATLPNTPPPSTSLDSNYEPMTSPSWWLVRNKERCEYPTQYIQTTHVNGVISAMHIIFLGHVSQAHETGSITVTVMTLSTETYRSTKMCRLRSDQGLYYLPPIKQF